MSAHSVVCQPAPADSLPPPHFSLSVRLRTALIVSRSGKSTYIGLRCVDVFSRNTTFVILWPRGSTLTWTTTCLTPSLPWHFKRTSKSQKFETLKPPHPHPLFFSLFFLALACERIFIKMHSTDYNLFKSLLGPGGLGAEH